MTPGTAYYLWYVSVPGSPSTRFIPVGVQDDPPPGDAPLIKSVRIGRSRAAALARQLSHLTGELTDFLGDLSPLPP